jgi:HK97 family phage major capsid protein
MSIKALRERLNALVTEVRSLSESEGWGAEKQSKYDQMMSEIESLKNQINAKTRAQELEAEMGGGEVVNLSPEQRRDAQNAGANSPTAMFNTWLRGGDSALNAEQWQIIRNTMSTTTNTEGGFTVQTDVAKSVLDKMVAYGEMRATSTVLRTSQGNPLSYPTSDGTGEEGELLDQNTSAADQDISFGSMPLPVYKYGSKVVVVPIELLQDSVVDIEAFVKGRLATRLARITNKHAAIGTGSGQPNGLVTAATVGVAGATGSVTSVTYDQLVDLQHSIDPAYRIANGGSFMVHDKTIAFLRKIKDTSNRPLFTPWYDDSTPGNWSGVLLGSKVYVNQYVPQMAANAKSILFGDLSAYVVRDVMDLTMYRFTDSPYTKKGQVGFMAHMRMGGNLMDVGGAVKVFQNSAT